ncbi:MAG: PD-(D/E)XK nuclease family protein [Pirellulaceae bacterium]
MPFHRHFLGWSQPALPAAADWLLARYTREDELDLSQAIVVLPGGRAGRRLLELLVAASDARSLVLTPPTITTEHKLPELLYQPKRPFANTLVQNLAWSAALRDTPAGVRRYFLPHPPPAGETARWLELGEMLRNLHVELAGDGLDFRDVLIGGESVPGFTEHDRWEALAEIQQRYLRTLDELGLWDLQTARLVAIRQREPQTERDIILLGMADLSLAQRQLLDLVARRVTALVVAPEELASRFDEHGCLLVEPWLQAEVPIRDEQLIRADGPADQAEGVARWLASLDGSYRADQIVVGVPDQRLAPQLERQLAQCQVASRWVEAKKLAETGPFRLLQLAGKLGERRRFSDLAALARHPDVFDWLLARIDRRVFAGLDLLTALDQFACDQIPAGLDPQRLEQEELAPIREIHAQLDQLLTLLPPAEQPLSDWAASFRKLLLAIYGAKQLDRNRPADRWVIEALEGIHAGLDELDAIPPSLNAPATLREALQIAVAPLGRETIPPPAAANVVELLGWLELPLDDAPALIVTTFNEGFVPQSAGVEPFLPNRLRQQLGLDHNDRRYARDAYATCVLLGSREQLRLVVAHRDSEGNPLSPSRLLFATEEASLARRAIEFFGDLPPTPPRRNLLAGMAPVRLTSALPVPQPRPHVRREGPERMSVTAFKAYLSCPYRYYLRHVLRLECMADGSAELDPAAFGNLLHDVLQRFGRAEDEDSVKARNSTRGDDIYGYLCGALDTLAGARFGMQHCRPAVRVQVEQARTRLRSLADWQARRTGLGWQIVHTEDTEARKQLESEFMVDDVSLTLHGRIDRIDYQPATRTLAILDYKTSDAGDEPKQTHCKGGQWVDLQLPLYRHLVQSAKLAGVDVSSCRVELGYIRIPKELRKIGEAIATWSDAELRSADEVARHVVRSVRAGVFWPPTCPPPAFCEDLAAITQDRRQGNRFLLDDEGEAA